MRSRRVILATASVLLVLAVVAGALAFDQLDQLRARQDEAREYVLLAREIGSQIDDGGWTLSDAGDVQFLKDVVEQLDKLNPREPLRGSRERLRTVLDERRDGELELTARELHRSTLVEIDSAGRDPDFYHRSGGSAFQPNPD